MKIAIVGAGGLGSKFGAGLARSNEVTLVHHRQEYVDAVNKNGLVVRHRDGSEERLRQVAATVDPADIQGTDVVVVTVKSYDTATVMAAVGPQLSDDGIAVTLQNGLGNLEAIEAAVGPGRAILGVTTEGATLLGPGLVQDGGQGETYIGDSADARDILGRLIRSLEAAGLPTQVADDVDGILWAKLAMVAGINSLAAVLAVPNGALGRHPEVRSICVEVIAEVASVAQAHGVEMAWDPVAAFDRVTQATANMPSGTLLDVLRGRRTEIDSILGEVVTRGQSAGLGMPVSETLWRLIKALEATAHERLDRTSFA